MTALEAVVKFCNDNLIKSEIAQKYYESRGWTQETIDKWELGFLAKTDILGLKTFVKRNDIDIRELEEKYVLFKNDFSFLTERVIFPIYDAYGETIGVSGRVLDDSKPKYYNTKFTKGSHLYGLNKAFKAIREKNMVYVFEGYADVITAHQNGMKNSVCCMGTAITEEHFLLLSRYTENIMILFDNDEGGKKARLTLNKKHLDDSRSSFENPKHSIYRAILHRHNDPDEFIKKEGMDKLVIYLDNCMKDEDLQRNLKKA